jgi:hypothetical protein
VQEPRTGTVFIFKHFLTKQHLYMSPVVGSYIVRGYEEAAESLIVQLHSQGKLRENKKIRHKNDETWDLSSGTKKPYVQILWDYPLNMYIGKSYTF